MAFRYTLQSVLRLRVSLERQEELRLFASAAVVARVRAEIDALDQNQLSRRRAIIEELQGGSSGAALHFSSVCDAAYAQLRKKLQAQLEAAESQRLAQLRIYQSARQKREVLEGLRDQQQAVFDLTFTRHEQQGADEAFLLGLFSGLRE
jgi:flagellar export protein FliJ